MKYCVALFVLLVLILTSCGNKNSERTAESSAVEVLECYRYIANKDSVVLRMKVSGPSVSGSLTYSLFEKDKNEGSISGEFKGDTLFAEYTFFSEGSISTRDVIFLRRGESLVEGYGESEEKNGRVVFKEGVVPEFSNTITLQRVNCTD